MNLIVFIDREQNLLSPFMIKDFKQSLEYLNKVVENNTVIFDEKSARLDNLLKSCKKIYFDTTKIDLEIPEFVRPVKTDKDYVSTTGDMFNEIGFLDNDRVFLFGQEFYNTMLKYSTLIYVVRFNVLNLNSNLQKYPDLLYDENFELLSGGIPYFNDNEQLNFSVYRNKDPKKYVREKKAKVELNNQAIN